MGSDLNNEPYTAPLTLAEERRLKLQEAFEEILGTSAAYFEPPESIRLKYPCIVYERSSGKTEFANNLPYKFDYRYTVTAMDLDPSSRIPEKLARLQCCTFDRGFVSDGLQHWVFTIY